MRLPLFFSLLLLAVSCHGAAGELERYAGQASRLHAADMMRFDSFSHGGRDRSPPPQHAAGAGYGYQATDKNIAGGQMNPEEAVAGWIKSPTHPSHS